jgi:hypothetical protein
MAFTVNDFHVRELAQVDHDTAVVGAEAQEAVAAAAHRQPKPGTGSESDGCLHVRNVLGPQDVSWRTRSQYRATRRFILCSARFDDVAAEVTAKGFQH